MGKRLTEKYDGNGNTILVEDPDYYDVDGKFHKKRKTVTNYTPPKKKRKKKK